MQCYVYKGDKKQDHYVFLAKRIDVSEPDKDLPAAIINLLGELSLVTEFELTPKRVLMQADSSQVMKDIHDQGFYLQMPKKDMRAEEDRLFS